MKEAADENKIFVMLQLETHPELSLIENGLLLHWNYQSPSKPGHFILINFHQALFLTVSSAQAEPVAISKSLFFS